MQNISIAVVGKNEKFHILDDKENSHYVSLIERRPPPPGPPPGDVGVGGNEPDPVDKAQDEKDREAAKGPVDPVPDVAMET